MNPSEKNRTRDAKCFRCCCSCSWWWWCQLKMYNCFAKHTRRQIHSRFHSSWMLKPIWCRLFISNMIFIESFILPWNRNFNWLYSVGLSTFLQIVYLIISQEKRMSKLIFILIHLRRYAFALKIEIAWFCFFFPFFFFFVLFPIQMADTLQSLKIGFIYFRVCVCFFFLLRFCPLFRFDFTTMSFRMLNFRMQQWIEYLNRVYLNYNTNHG